MQLSKTEKHVRLSVSFILPGHIVVGFHDLPPFTLVPLVLRQATVWQEGHGTYFLSRTSPKKQNRKEQDEKEVEEEEGEGG